MSTRAPRGREARSSWTVAERFDGAALLRVRIHTGRTHQIRVHLASIGHPVAGDATYGGTRTPSSRKAAARQALASLERPALHAARLAFAHPASGERCEFEAPLPADLEARARGPARGRALLSRAIIRAMPDTEPSARVPQHRRVYAGRVVSLDVDEVSEPGGVEGTREVVRQSRLGGGAAGARGRADRAGPAVPLRRRRAGVGAAGRPPRPRRDARSRRAARARGGSRPARRRARAARSSFWTTPGFCDELMHLFRATSLEAVPPRPEADERIEQASFTLDEAMAMLRRGEIREGKTLVALLLEARPAAGLRSLSNGTRPGDKETNGKT